MRIIKTVLLIAILLSLAISTSTLAMPSPVEWIGNYLFSGPCTPDLTAADYHVPRIILIFNFTRLDFIFRPLAHLWYGPLEETPTAKIAEETVPPEISDEETTERSGAPTEEIIMESEHAPEPHARIAAAITAEGAAREGRLRPPADLQR